MYCQNQLKNVFTCIKFRANFLSLKKGITINSLWVRLVNRENFDANLDDQYKAYIWKCIETLSDIEFYVIQKPRPDVVPYNRFHYVDPESRHFLETVSWHVFKWRFFFWLPDVRTFIHPCVNNWFKRLLLNPSAK